jgi:hypothetical protein
VRAARRRGEVSRGDKPSPVLPSQHNPKPVEPSRNDARRWWLKSGADCAKAIQTTVETLQQAQSPRIRQQVINQSLYGNRRLTSVQAQARARLLQSQSTAKNMFVSDNVVQTVIDTATSKIGENKPRPYFLTSGGNYKQQRKAKRLNKYIDGVFFEQKAYDLMPVQFRDAAIDGDGFIRAGVRAGKVRYKCVSSMELWCDDEEAQYGRPRNLFYDYTIDRDELEMEWPKAAAAIAAATNDTQTSRQQTTSDRLRVIEAWHLGVTDAKGNAKGGKHAIALVGGGGAMLLEPEEWKHDFVPFSKMPWSAPPTGGGYFGQALAEQLAGDQIELNKELRLVQQSMHMAGVLKYFYKIGSKIVQEHINNELGTGIAYAGDTPPQFFCPEPIHERFFTNPERIRERMFRRAGYSEMTVSGEKPPGIESGRALRELEDQGSDRHKTTVRQYDSAALQLADITIALSIEAAAKGELEAVKVPGKLAFDSIDFKSDLKGLERSEFTLQCYTVSRLPKEPGARLQTIQEHIQAGIISIRQGRKLLDFPDLEAFETLADAMETIIQKTLDGIVDDGEYAPPEPWFDLALAKEMVTEYIAHFSALDLEPERKDDLLTWSMQVDELTAAALPAAMSGAAPSMGAPQAAPMPPPQSDLIPNAPQQQMKAAA